MSKNILVTGGCGFIGSNIVRKLYHEDYTIKVIDNLSSGKREYIQDCLEDKTRCTLVEGSINDISLLEKELDGIDAVIHEAANPDVRTSKDNLFEDFNVNVVGTLNLLQALAKNNVPKIVFASSGGTVYGETEVLPTPESHPFAPISHYGATKASCEQYLSSFASLYGIRAVSLRLGNIFGPPSNHGVMHDFYWKLKKNPRKLEILGDGKQVKSYLFVDDCVEANLQALKINFDGHIAFNIATSEGISVIEIADEVITAMGLENVEYSFTGGERGWEGDVKRSVTDITKAETMLKWKPKTSVKEGIRKYISWLIEKNG